MVENLFHQENNFRANQGQLNTAKFADSHDNYADPFSDLPDLMQLNYCSSEDEEEDISRISKEIPDLVEPESDDELFKELCFSLGQGQTPEVHQYGGKIEYKSISTETKEEIIDKEIEGPVLTPAEHQIKSNESKTDHGYSSVFSLGKEDVDITITDDVKHLLSEKTTEQLIICDDESVLQCCKINSAALDSTDRGIFLIGSIGNKAVPMMIDTGASCSVMSRKVYDSIPDVQKPHLIDKKCGIRSVSGDLMKCHGVIEYSMEVNGIKLPITFHVADIHDKIILGMSFLSEFGGTLDTKHGTMVIKDKTVPCIVLNGRPRPRRVYITGEYIIPPGTEMILPGKSKDKEGQPRTNTTVPMLFEPKPSFTKEHGLLVCASTTMNNKEIVPVRVFNPTEEPITLTSGRDGIRCGYLAPTDVENEIFSKADMVAQVGIDLERACNNELPSHLRDLFAKSCVNLTEAEQALVKEKLIKYQDIFSKGENDVGRTTVTEHKIETKTENPLRQRPRPLPLKQNEEVERQIRLLLESGMISVSNSAWSSPIVCVRKKDGSLRMCCDYRKLNDITVKDAHPIPPINQSIDALNGAKYFCSLDLVSGYYQVPMHPDSKAKTAFCSRSGLYEWNVMSFGLCNAPATFQRMMEKILSGLHWSICMVYLDDILVYGTTVVEVLDRLELVFTRIRGAGLKLKPKKCSLFATEVLYLGYIIGRNGIHTDPSKIKDVKEFPVPTDVNGVRKFLGLTNYYRKFVKDYAKIAFPLNRILDKKGKKPLFHWTPDCQKAFDTLRERLITAPILTLPREEGIFVVDTDSSAEGIGGVLHQMQDGELKVIAYSSKALSKAERNYCVSRQELLAIVYHILHWKCYLWGNHFTVRTDHASLRYLINFKDVSGQLARWIDALSEFDYEIQSRPGSKNGNADSMSRIPCGGKRCLCEYSCSDPTLNDFKERPCPLRTTQSIDLDTPVSCEDIAVEAVCSFNKVYIETEVKATAQDRSTELPFPWTKESIKEAQKLDPVLSEIIYWVEKKEKPKWNDVSHLGKDVKSYLAGWKNLLISDETLYRKTTEAIENQIAYQLVIPEYYKSKLLHQYHDANTGGHLGFAKVYAKMHNKYFWSDMKEEILLYCRTCFDCQRKKNPPKSFCAPLQRYIVGVPFERVACDVMGPILETERGNRYILIVTDYFSRWVEAYPLQNQTAESIAGVLAREWIARFGCPAELHSDNGSNFESEIVHELCRLLGIDKTSTVVRRPQSDGVCERFNHTVQAMIATVLDAETVFDWDIILPFLMMAYRSSKHESTGFSPCKMVFGKEIALPIEAYTPNAPSDKEFNAPEFVKNIKGKT